MWQCDPANRDRPPSLALLSFLIGRRWRFESSNAAVRKGCRLGRGAAVDQMMAAISYGPMRPSYPLFPSTRVRHHPLKMYQSHRLAIAPVGLFFWTVPLFAAQVKSKVILPGHLVRRMANKDI